MRILVYSLIAGALALSCGSDEVSIDSVIETNDLSQLNAHRDILKSKENDLFMEIQKLEEAIARLDTNISYPQITVQEMKKDTFIHFVEFQGDIATDRNVVMYPEFAGILSQVNVKAGQEVSKGQVLARIDDGGLSQQRAAMQVQVDLAKTTYEKQSRLWEKNIGSEMQYLQAKSAYESQLASLEQMDRQIGKTVIRAPFSGVIDEVITKQGSVVAPGASPVIRVVNLRDMYVEVSVPEVHLSTMKKGRSAIVEVPVVDMKIESEIRSVASFVHPANRTFKVQLDVRDRTQTVKPNLNAKVKINDYTNTEALMIPQSVVNENAEGREFVYAISDRNGDIGVAYRTFVELGKTRGDDVEVLSGLSFGDAVVIEGARAITEGQEVQILESKTTDNVN